MIETIGHSRLGYVSWVRLNSSIRYEDEFMNRFTINQFFLAAIFSTTVIALAAIILDYDGGIDISCSTSGCRLLIESRNSGDSL